MRLVSSDPYQCERRSVSSFYTRSFLLFTLHISLIVNEISLKIISKSRKVKELPRNEMRNMSSDQKRNAHIGTEFDLSQKLHDDKF